MLFITSLSLLSVAAAAPLAQRAVPTVLAPSPQATISGLNLAGVESFRGIPFAQPPVGQLRLKPPQPITSPLGNIDGTTLLPRACPQFFFSVGDSGWPQSVAGTLLNLPIFQKITNAGEDCLTLNIQRPAGTKEGDKLPVLFWMFGGGFQLGSTQMYEATGLITESVAQGKPVILVAVNYRLGAFGWLPGKEILADGSSNLGLLDQRLAMKWVADNIAAFGGDPDKVTIWGESAGALSVMDHMMLFNGDHTYKGKPLFRAGIMDSGSVIPADPVDCPKAQAIYDTVVEKAGCAGTADTLACLRSVPYETFLTASNSVPGINSFSTVNLSYLPRPDGTTLIESPDIVAAKGNFAKVPFIVGDQEDEGTLFGLSTSNLTTKQDVKNYFTDIYFKHASREQISQIVDAYDNTWDDGSPFRTGPLNNWYPQFKRISAILGDLVFTLTRRLFLETSLKVHPDVKAWSYLATYDYGTPIMGTFHITDIIQVFYGIKPNNAARSIRGYYFSFVYHLDPNVDNNFGTWPEWSQGQKLRDFQADSNSYLDDNFRAPQYNLLKQLVTYLRV